MELRNDCFHSLLSMSRSEFEPLSNAPGLGYWLLYHLDFRVWTLPILNQRTSACSSLESLSALYGAKKENGMESKDTELSLGRRATLLPTASQDVRDPSLGQSNGQCPREEGKELCNSQKCEVDANASSATFNSCSQAVGVKVDWWCCTLPWVEIVYNLKEGKGSKKVTSICNCDMQSSKKLLKKSTNFINKAV